MHRGLLRLVLPAAWALACTIAAPGAAAAERPPEATTKPVVVPAVDAPAQAYDAGSLRVLLPAASTDGRFAVVELHESPGYRTPRHVHPEMDESFYVLEGSLSIEIHGRTQLLPAGSYVHIPRGTPHSQGSADDRPVRLLATLSPGGFEQFFLDRWRWRAPYRATIRRSRHGWWRSRAAIRAGWRPRRHPQTARRG